ncbi:hypothetical protein V6N12_020406 [Hibiscus sabdariffa]|uniref:Uncharacterized protein n=1 Tax=Hibiscus sabdariffa TaxID=183260 RepID=A0ABR2CXZ8_9ROSI
MIFYWGGFPSNFQSLISKIGFLQGGDLSQGKTPRVLGFLETWLWPVMEASAGIMRWRRRSWCRIRRSAGALCFRERLRLLPRWRWLNIMLGGLSRYCNSVLAFVYMDPSIGSKRVRVIILGNLNSYKRRNREADWDVVVRHVSRDMNKVTDSLAQRGRELGAGSSAFYIPSEGTTTLVIQEQGASGVVPGMHAQGAPVISGAAVGIG